MIKIGAALAIVIICGLVGLMVANNFKQRPWQLRQLQSGLQMLETEIAYTATPLPEAMGKVAQQLDSPLDILFLNCSQGLEQRRGIQVSQAWQLAIGELAQESVLTDRDLAVLRTLGHNLGSSDREEQLKHLQLVKVQLHQHEQSAEEEKIKGEKLWRYCGFLTGLIIVLLIF